MPRKLISSGSTFEGEIGYSRAVLVGDWVFVSGTTGFDYSTMSIADDLVTQTEQCLKNIELALRQAGSPKVLRRNSSCGYDDFSRSSTPMRSRPAARGVTRLRIFRNRESCHGRYDRSHCRI
jgi:enamine deaminase RidA (YjgF/YER057c/UK114 family)